MNNFDLTKVKRDPVTGSVLTGPGQLVDAASLNDQGYRQALAYAGGGAPAVSTSNVIAGNVTGAGQPPKSNSAAPSIFGNNPPTNSMGQFSSLISGALDRLKSNDQNIQYRNLLIKHLYDGGGLTSDEMNALPGPLQQAINGGDKPFVEMQLRLLNDNISGRSNTLNQSLSFLTSGYKDTLAAIEQQKSDALTAFKDYASATGDTDSFKKFIISNYGDYLTSAGVDPSQFVDSTLGGGSSASATTTVAKLLGINDPSTPLSSAVAVAGGPDEFAKLMTQNEGSSPKGVNNNPGNIKYTGLPGQTDSGVKATDGGTFASYATPEDGYTAIASIVKNAMDGKSSAYGANPTLDSFVSKYTNTPLASAVTNNQPSAPGTTGSSQINASVQGYATRPLSSAGGLTQAAIDQAAMKYALTGTMPSIGLSSTGQGGLRKNAILNRAGELEGASNIEGNKVKLAALSTSLGKQTDYLNTMERSINTVDDNLKILMDGADKVNKSGSPLVNEWTNLANQKVIGSGDLNAYKAAIQTVRTEYSNILARGGQVTDTARNEAMTLIPDNITKTQLQKVVGVLQAEGSNVKKEAQNQVDSIADQINSIVAPSSGGTSAGAGSYDDYLKAIGQ